MTARLDSPRWFVLFCAIPIIGNMVSLMNCCLGIFRHYCPQHAAYLRGEPLRGQHPSR